MTDDELLFIYSKLEIPHDQNIILTTKWFNNEHLLIINYTKENIKHNAFYDTKRVLGVDFVIADQEKDEQHDEEPDDQDPDEETDQEHNEQANQKQKTPKKPKKKQEIMTTTEASFWFHQIMTNTEKSPNTHIINIDDLHSIRSEPNANTNVFSPCGSGKSFIVLEKDILAALN